MPYFYFDDAHKPFCESLGDDYVMRKGEYLPALENDYNEPLGIDLINIDKSMMDCWGDVMDLTREEHNDVNNYHSNNQICYRHYKLSPDPKDNVTLEELKEFCLEYCDRVYENRFEIAIVYHNDNNNNILHAHILVNAPILNKDGLKQGTNYFSTFFKEDNYPGRFQWHMALREQMAYERGWHNFLEEDMNDLETARLAELGIEHKQQEYWGRPEDEEERKIIFEADRDYFERNYYYNYDEQYSRPYKKMNHNKSNIQFSSNGWFYDKKERAVLKRYGTSYKQMLREKIEVAKYYAQDENEFFLNMNDLDVSVLVNKNNEYVFCMRIFDPDNNKNYKDIKILASKLGSHFQKKTILRSFKLQDFVENNFNGGINESSSNNNFVDSELIFDRYQIDIYKHGYRYGKREKEIIAADGWSNMEDIRQRVSRAIDNSYDEKSFIFKCMCYGIDIEITKDNDYKFSHPDKEINLFVTGNRLGSLFSKQNIFKKFGISTDNKSSTWDTNNVKDVMDIMTNKKNFLKKFNEMEAISSGDNMTLLETEEKISTQDVVKALIINKKFDITCIDDYFNKLDSCVDENDKKLLTFARDTLFKFSKIKTEYKNGDQNYVNSHYSFLFNREQNDDKKSLLRTTKKNKISKNKSKQIVKEFKNLDQQI